MTALFVFILLAITGIFFSLKYIKTGFLFLLITLIAFFSIGTGMVSSLFLKKLESTRDVLIHPHWGKENIIILLGSGITRLPQTAIYIPPPFAFARIYETARLYQSCIKTKNLCTVIISGGDPLRKGRSEATAYKNALMHIGVKETDIISETKSANTYQNAKFTSAILKEKYKNNLEKVKTIFLVTSNLHMKRSLLYFSYFNIDAIPAAADYIPVRFSILPSGYNFFITDFALHEYFGILEYLFLHPDKIKNLRQMLYLQND